MQGGGFLPGWAIEQINSFVFTDFLRKSWEWEEKRVWAFWVGFGLQYWRAYSVVVILLSMILYVVNECQKVVNYPCLKYNMILIISQLKDVPVKAFL